MSDAFCECGAVGFRPHVVTGIPAEPGGEDSAVHPAPTGAGAADPGGAEGGTSR